MASKNSVHFTVNGKKCTVGSDVSSDVSLLDYIRNKLELRGTKYMCREAGCGVCIVSVIKSPGTPPESVNSCMVSVTSCFNWAITTIEDLGNRKDGYHEIQKTLADEFGTQCGHCTPGWIMSLYSLLKSDKKLSMLDMEKSFGSNICRCTGYRPILEAFKKFAVDSPKSIENFDIEDIPICKKSGKQCDKKNCNEEDEWCMVENDDILRIELKDGRTWFRAKTVIDIFNIFETKGTSSYMLVAGNTAKGVVPITTYPNLLIDVSGVSELKGHNSDQNLSIGAGTTLTELIRIFDEVSEEDNFKYLNVLKEHVEAIAHIPVRNIGTIAGNLMTKHKHNKTTSDLFLLFLTVGAELEIAHYQEGDTTVTMERFLDLDMVGRVIKKVILPPLSKTTKVVTYKITPRVQNAHAIVNAGLYFRLTESENKVEEARIIYSGLKPPFSRPTELEQILSGKKLFENDTLQEAVKQLDKELVAEENLPEPSPKYRKAVAISLFYKGVLSLCPPDKMDKRYRSGAKKIHDLRPVTKGNQIFETDSSKWPLTKPIQKVEAIRQCSGEAVYSEDIHTFPNEVYATYVLSTVHYGEIENIDPSEALEQPGVLAFYSAKDIPGKNSFTPVEHPFFTENEELLCSKDIRHFDQPIGVIVGETQHIAEIAAKMVKVTYKNTNSKPVLDLRKAKEDSSRVDRFFRKPPLGRGLFVNKVIKGEQFLHHQAQMPMETMVCITNPIDDRIDVYCSTHWPKGVQIVSSRAIGIDANSINVSARRLGGSFGLKLSRCTQIATLTCLVTKNLNRPCRFILPLTTVMRLYGKRLPCSGHYEIGVDRSGEIQYNDYKYYQDEGFMVNEILQLFTIISFSNAYRSIRWTFEGYHALTDTHKNTWCRAPGTVGTIGLAELMMDQIAYEAKIDPIDVRVANLDDDSKKIIKEMLKTLRAEAEYDKRKREVDEFNGKNRWMKRGLRVAIMKWTPTPISQRLSVSITVFQADATVLITHAGIDMGQGLNTKAIQICAHLLGVPVEKIKVKAGNSLESPNSTFSGGSITSLNIGAGVKTCCEKILKNLAPIRLLRPSATWEELIEAATLSGTTLHAHDYRTYAEGLKDLHVIHGVAFSEVQVDILTGQSEILRVDIIEDVGQSVNPQIDVGQVEGAFVMGIGFWTTEDIIYDPENGEMLTDRTWHYNVPLARDIPQIFNIKFREDSFSTKNYFGAKATSEPPMCLSIAVPLAMRQAITSSRVESGKAGDSWFKMDAPYSVDRIFLAAETRLEEYVLNKN